MPIEDILYLIHAFGAFIALIAFIGLFWNRKRLSWHYRTRRRAVKYYLTLCAAALALWFALLWTVDGHVSMFNWIGHAAGIAVLALFCFSVGKALHEF